MIENMTGRARVWWRERQERLAEKKAQKALHQHHAASQLHGHTTRLFLLHLPATAGIAAMVVEVFWAMLFCIEATGLIDWNVAYRNGSATPFSFIWDFAFTGHLPVLLGLLAATLPIIIYGAVWLPMQFALRGSGRWKRGTLITVGLMANVLIAISGTVVMNNNRQEHVRDALVIEQRGDAGRQALVARRDAIQQRWHTLTEGNTLQAQAAREGVAGWDARIATARAQFAAGTMPQRTLNQIERARGSAVAAEAYQAQMDEMTGQIAAAAPAAATAAHVEDTTGAPLDQFAQQVGVWRPVFVAVICSAIGVLSSWWVLAMLEGMNPRDVLRSGWADEGHRIEDKRGQAVVDSEGRVKDVEPMTPPKEVVTDAETGEELEKIKPKEYWRRRVRKGKPTRVNIEPDIPPDERGIDPALDGGDDGLRSAKGDHEPVSVEPSEGVPPDANVVVEERVAHQEEHAEEQSDEQPDQQSDLSEEEAAALLTAAEGVSVEYVPDQTDDDSDDDQRVADGEENVESTDHPSPPVVPRALLAAAE